MIRQSALILCACRVALSCSCLPATPICSRIDKTAVLFVGDVISSNDDKTGTFAQLTLERVRVVESFKGLPENTKEVWVDPGSMTSCYDPHKPGKRYLIAAMPVRPNRNLVDRSVDYRGEKKPFPAGFDLDTSVLVWSDGCSGSALAEYAADDIAFLQAWRRGLWNPNIIGRLIQSASHFRGLPLKGATVTLTGPDGSRSTVTGDNGAFEFGAVAPGKYQLRFYRSGYKPLHGAS